MFSKKINRREMLQGLGLTLAASALAACAPQVSEEEKATEAPKPTEEMAATPAPVEKVTLRMMRVGGSMGEHYPQVVEMFMEQNPDIEVTMEDIAYGDVWMKTEMGFAAGDLQDVVHSFTRYYFLGASQGFYMPVDDVLQDLVPDYDDYYEVAMENIRFEGKLYGLLEAAYIGPTAFLVWNRHLIEEAGVEPPTPDTDMNGLYELAIKCTNVDKEIFGLEMNHNTIGRLCNTLRTYGKPEYGVNGDTSSWLVSPDGKKFRFVDNPAAEEYFTKWYRPLQDAGVLPRVFESGLFQAGKAAMFQGHHGWVSRLNKDCEWGYDPKDSLLMPVGAQGRRGTSQESHMKCVYSQTKHSAEALRLSAFVTGTEAGKLSLQTHGGLSARKSVYNDPELWESYPHYKLHHETLLSGIVEPYPMPWNFRDQEVLDAHKNLFAPLYDGSTTFEEVAPTIQEEIQKIVDQPRP